MTGIIHNPTNPATIPIHLPLISIFWADEVAELVPLAALPLLEPELLAAIRVVSLVPVETLPSLVLVARVVLPLPVITDNVTSAVPDNFVVAAALGAVPVPRVVEGV
jgi:hypothetical protein